MERPESDIRSATGMVGLVALLALTAFSTARGLAPAPATFLLVGGTAFAMIAWSLVVEKVHRNPSTGLDFSRRRATAETWAVVRTKLAGFAATLALVAAGYGVLEHYAEPRYDFYFLTLGLALPAVAALAPAYIWFTSRRMVEPRDGLWHFGRLVTGRGGVDRAAVADHLRGWAIKAFFLAYLMSIVPGIVAGVVHFDLAALATDPAAPFFYLIRLSFLANVVFASIGYVLTARLLDAHIRSANPYFAAWVFALACYPPVILMASGGPLDYRAGTTQWTEWFGGSVVALTLWGSAIVALTLFYAWSTAIYGIRFSNLTHRGIVTTGPYRWFKHPAYLSKNLAWWLIYVPFLAADGAAEAIENCALLLSVNAIYFARARTEERHLMADPRYRAYAAWIGANGVLPRVAARIRYRPA